MKQLSKIEKVEHFYVECLAPAGHPEVGTVQKAFTTVITTSLGWVIHVPNNPDVHVGDDCRLILGKPLVEVIRGIDANSLKAH